MRRRRANFGSVLNWLMRTAACWSRGGSWWRGRFKQAFSRTNKRRLRTRDGLRRLVEDGLQGNEC